MYKRELIEEIVEMHGGWERWHRVERIGARLAFGGATFKAHQQPSVFNNLKVAVNPRQLSVTIYGFGSEAGFGRWMPRSVQLFNGSRALIAERQHPRAALGALSKKFRWDSLDVLYIMGFSIWNCLSFPFTLDTPDVALTETRAHDGEGFDTLCAKFDFRLPTHSIHQKFHFNQRRPLVRHDYTRAIVGPWATSSQLCLATEAVAGLRFYTRRKVLPRIGQRLVLPYPVVEWIEFDDMNVWYAE